MNEMTRGFALLMSMTIEAVVVLLLCWWGGRQLETHYPIGIKWSLLLFPIGFLLVGMNVYKVIKLAMKSPESKDND